MVDSQSVAAEIRLGKKRKIETTEQKYMACPITQGGHNNDVTLCKICHSKVHHTL